MKKYDKQYGFSLIELMMVVMILLILASITVPAFQKYMRRSKNAEALMTLSTLNRFQLIAYTEYNRFSHCTTSIIPPSSVALWQEGSKIKADFPCSDDLEFPLSDGSYVHFFYQTTAGKYSGANTLDPSIPAADNKETSETMLNVLNGNSGSCTGAGAGVTSMSGVSLGLEASPPAGYGYYVASAMANLAGGGIDFTNDGGCSLVFQVVEVDPTVSEGFLIGPAIVYAFQD
ncbi:MAG: pilin [Bdellovibrionales bacterium]|nr:pilin [Bdellovibrionales bacterium]